MVEKRFKVLLLYIIFIMIIIISPRAYALEYNMNNQTSATKNGTTNRYLASEIYNTGTTNTYTFGTRYTGKISSIDTYFNYPFEANTTYRLTYNMNTEDFRNTFAGTYWWDCTHTMTALTQQVGTFTYISYKKVQFTFTPTENTTCIRVLLGSSNLSQTAITGISNWRLDSITLYDPDYQSGSGSGQGSTSPTPTPSTATNQDIINNQNNNTQDIINSNNENTQNIIENNNTNTQNIIDNQNKACPVETVFQKRDLYLAEIGYLDSSGNIQSGAYQVSKYLEIKPDEDYEINFNFQSTDPIYSCLYNGRKQVIRCLPSNSRTLTFTSASNEYYLRVSGTIRNAQLFPIYIKGSICNNWELEAQNDIKNTLTDDNIDDNLGGGFFNDFSNTDNGGISAIVTKPLMIVNNLLSNNGQCSNLNLPEFMGVSTAYLPSGCILWDNATPTMINLWNIFVCGLGSYFILKDIFRIIENLKNPDNDKVEVMDL